MLMAAPVPSTGAVATSPSLKKAICPFANELAGATAAAGAGAPVAAPEAEADAEADAAAVGLVLAVALGKPPNRCRWPNADWLIDVE
jgi:hypothetical protein